MTKAYPLAWPRGFPRAKHREKGAFRTTLPAALKNVTSSIAAFSRDSGKKIEGIVLSSNVTLGVSVPADPGVSAWFSWDGLPICIPVDRYLTPEANLQAIHHILEARRVELPHGTLALVRATFEGFRALPAPRSWQDILGVAANAGAAEINAAFRARAAERHPDKPGGSQSAMAELNAARDAALKERG